MAVNVMAHVHAATGMLERGRGHLLTVGSAAGMLTAPGAAAYTTSKHAAQGFAEWMAITYGDRGIDVSIVNPGPIETEMLATSLAAGNEGVHRVAAASEVISADAAAKLVVEGIKAGRFLITTHSDTISNTQKKWSDIERWISGMRKFLRADI